MQKETFFAEARFTIAFQPSIVPILFLWIISDGTKKINKRMHEVQIMCAIELVTTIVCWSQQAFANND